MRRLKNSLPNVRGIGPYLLIELLLPGGTLLAFLLWFSQVIIRSGFPGALPPVVPPSTVERVVTLPQSLHTCGGCTV